MEKTAGAWKVFDVKIEGVSLITTYRETFALKVREGGIEGLIKTLTDKNRDADARVRARQIGDFFPPVIYLGVRDAVSDSGQTGDERLQKMLPGVQTRLPGEVSPPVGA